MEKLKATVLFSLSCLLLRRLKDLTPPENRSVAFRADRFETEKKIILRIDLVSGVMTFLIGEGRLNPTSGALRGRRIWSKAMKSWTFFFVLEVCVCV